MKYALDLIGSFTTDCDLICELFEFVCELKQPFSCQWRENIPECFTNRLEDGAESVNSTLQALNENRTTTHVFPALQKSVTRIRGLLDELTNSVTSVCEERFGLLEIADDDAEGFRPAGPDRFLDSSHQL